MNIGILIFMLGILIFMLGILVFETNQLFWMCKLEKQIKELQLEKFKI